MFMHPTHHHLFHQLYPGRVMRGQKWVFALEGTRGVPQVSCIKSGGAIQGFGTPFMIWGFLNKLLHPGRFIRGEKWVFAPEGARGMTEVSPTKMVG